MKEENNGFVDGIQVTVDFKLNLDRSKGKPYLEVMNNISQETVRMYYHIVDEQYVRNMPQEMLIGSYNNLKNEILRRQTYE